MTSAAVPAVGPITWLRSWIYFFAFLAWTIGAAILYSPMLLSPRWTLKAVRIWTGGVAALARAICGIDSRIEGLEHVPPGACIIAAQHQSSFETYHLFTALEHPVFILKRELTWIPVIGWYMQRAGFISIDRGAGAGAMKKMLRGAQAALAAGHQIVVFPEGTRVKYGEDRPYHPGIAALYAHSDVPVIPMALNSGIYWGKTRILKVPGTIVFRFLPAVPRGLEKEELLATLKARLEAVGL